MGARCSCSSGTKKQVAAPSESKPGKRRVAFADDVHISGNDGQDVAEEDHQSEQQEELPSGTNSDDGFSHLDQEDQDQRRKEMFERRRAKSTGRQLQAPDEYANRPAMRANAQKRSTINLQAQLLESGIDEGLDDHNRTALASKRCSILDVFSVMGICPAPEDKDKMGSAWENQDYELPPSPRHSPASTNRQRGAGNRR